MIAIKIKEGNVVAYSSNFFFFPILCRVEGRTIEKTIFNNLGVISVSVFVP